MHSIIQGTVAGTVAAAAVMLAWTGMDSSRSEDWSESEHDTMVSADSPTVFPDLPSVRAADEHIEQQPRLEVPTSDVQSPERTDGSGSRCAGDEVDCAGSDEVAFSGEERLRLSREASDRAIAEMDAVLSREDRDTRWSDTEEQRLWDVSRQQLANIGVVPDSVDCRTTFCKVQFLGADSALMESVVNGVVSGEMEMLYGGAVHRSESTGELAVYFAREGAELPVVE